MQLEAKLKLKRASSGGNLGVVMKKDGELQPPSPPPDLTLARIIESGDVHDKHVGHLWMCNYLN